MSTRRTFLTGALLVGSSALAARSMARPDAGGGEMRFWDNHAGFGYESAKDIELLDHWRNAGVHYLSVNVGFDLMPWSSTFLAIANYTQAIAAREDYALGATLADVEAAWRAGRMAITFDIEGMSALNGELSLVELYYRLGVRQMAIA